MKLTADKIKKEFIRENRAKGSNVFAAVEETALTLEGGCLTVLMGRSGSGKSTLLNMLGGLSKPSSGRVLADDTDIYQLSDKALSRLRNEKFGMVPQGQTALYSLTVQENILLPFSLYGDQPDISYAQELMERLDILPLANARPAELSGGELRRTAIARALVRKPAVILADEPTGDLDDENTAVVFQMLKAAAEGGTAVLVVTHENDAASYADRLLRMSAGRIEGL